MMSHIIADWTSLTQTHFETILFQVKSWFELTSHQRLYQHSWLMCFDPLHFKKGSREKVLDKELPSVCGDAFLPPEENAPFIALKENVPGDEDSENLPGDADSVPQGTPEAEAPKTQR